MNKEQILYEDHEMIVCYKPAGCATQTAKIGQPDMVSMAANYLNASKENVPGRVSGGQNAKQPYVGLVHRLDQPVEGVLVLAKNQKAAAALSRQITENRMEKYYYAAVCMENMPGQPQVLSEGTLTDYLNKDAGTNTSCVVTKEHRGAKKAELSYKIIERKFFNEDDGTQAALAEIKLITGRHHQIRVQMSHAGMGLLGDWKYAGEKARRLSDLLQPKQIALCAYKLSFYHPVTNRPLTFQIKPKGEIFQNFL